MVYSLIVIDLVNDYIFINNGVLHTGGKQLTIKDVAKKAGVSVATVSRVLNNPECVKYATKEKVLKVIKDLDYSPNLLGRNLRKLETKKIMIVLDNISNQFYSNVVKGIEDRAKESGFTVMLCTMRGSKDNFYEAMNLLSNRVVDGALVFCGDLDAKKLRNMEKDYPIVCLCEIVEDVCNVCVNDYQAGFDATNYLLQLGKKDIAIVCQLDDIEKNTSSGYRLRGYIDALKQKKIEFNKDLVIGQYDGEDTVKSTVDNIFKLNKLPDAIFALSDTTAIQIIKELSLRGIRVPEDISIMGFDNTLMSEVYIPSITTVAQPQYEIGYEGTEILLEQMDKKENKLRNKKVFLKHKIISRDSVK